METVLNIIFYTFVLTGLGIACFFVFPAIVKIYRMQYPSKKINMNLSNLLASFKKTNNGSELGVILINLMKIGYYQQLKTINHSVNFPDEKQYQGFLRYATPEIAQSINTLGDSLEKYVI